MKNILDDSSVKRFLPYGHGGAFNHGAEAAVKLTIEMIRQKYDNVCIALSSHFPEQDREFMIDADEFFSPVPEFWKRECAPVPKQKKKRRNRKNSSRGQPIRWIL